MPNEKERLSVAGLACLLAGVPKIQAFNEGGRPAEFLSEFYEPLVESELSLYKWRFATTYYDISPNLISAVPLSRFNVAYQLPTSPSVVSVDTVLINDKPIQYERRGQEIHTRDTSGDTVILQYRYRADESLWYPYFRQLIVYRLATGLAFSVTRKVTIASEMKTQADEHWMRAKTEDAQSQTNQKMNLNRLKRGRRGSVARFWRD